MYAYIVLLCASLLPGRFVFFRENFSSISWLVCVAPCVVCVAHRGATLCLRIQIQGNVGWEAQMSSGSLGSFLSVYVRRI